MGGAIETRERAFYCEISFGGALSIARERFSDKIVTAGRELFDVINRLDVEPQWVPAAWLRAPSAFSAFTEAAQRPPMCSDASPAQHIEPVKQQRVSEVLVEQVQSAKTETSQSEHDTAASVAPTTAL